jgi:hypothetical protein
MACGSLLGVLDRDSGSETFFEAFAAASRHKLEQIIVTLVEVKTVTDWFRRTQR